MNVGFEQGELLRTVDRCYEAGEPTATVYDASAAARHWETLLALLEETLRS